MRGGDEVADGRARGAAREGGTTRRGRWLGCGCWLVGSGAGRAGGRTLGRRASRAERETVGRAGGSKWAAEKKGGGLGRSGWAGAGLTLVVGLFSISLFLILNQSNTFEFK